MAKRKLKRFEEMKKFSNVLQPEFNEVYNKDFAFKGKWNKSFFQNDNPIIVDLGCGKGEYTIELARRFEEKNYIGIDIKGARIWKGAKQALDENINNAAFIRTRVELINSFFDSNEIDEIWLLFPDPQPKKKKKRLTSGKFLNLYKKILRTDGIVHLKTDSDLLYLYTLEIAKYNNLKVECFTDDLYNSNLIDDSLSIKTYYENQFLEQGSNINYLRFKLNNQSLIEESAEVT